MTITSFKPLDKNTLKGVFDLELTSGLTIVGAMLMANEKGSWCAFPSIPQYQKDGDSYKPLMKDGKQVYKPTIMIPDRATRDKFNDQVLAALRSQGHVS